MPGPDQVLDHAIKLREGGGIAGPEPPEMHIAHVTPLRDAVGPARDRARSHAHLPRGGPQTSRLLDHPSQDDRTSVDDQGLQPQRQHG